jgi:hypothetical protein
LELTSSSVYEVRGKTDQAMATASLLNSLMRLKLSGADSNRKFRRMQAKIFALRIKQEHFGGERNLL